MIDMHIHLERGPYTKEWLMEFVNVALENDIKKIGILEHSHRFKEFREIYQSVEGDTEYGKYQKQWLDSKSVLSLQQYKDFILEMRELNFPIEIEFGLEVCFFPDKIADIKNCLSDFDWDFKTGSIHWIEGWGFDHPKTMNSWNIQDVDDIYEEYYKLMLQLIESNVFDVLAHPDSIKCFGHTSSRDMRKQYKEISQAVKEHGITVEFNTGLNYRYGHKDIGINRDFLDELVSSSVNFITVSDAHCPEDVGRMIKEAKQILNDVSFNASYI